MASKILNNVERKTNLLLLYALNAKQKSFATKGRISLTWLFRAKICQKTSFVVTLLNMKANLI